MVLEGIIKEVNHLKTVQSAKDLGEQGVIAWGEELRNQVGGGFNARELSLEII